LPQNVTKHAIRFDINETVHGVVVISGAGTNLKADRVPSLFGSESTILVVLVSAFVMVSTVWSVSCLLFFYSRCFPCPAICKSGGHVLSVSHGVGTTGGDAP